MQDVFRVVLSAIKLGEHRIGLSEHIVYPDTLQYPAITICVRPIDKEFEMNGYLRDRFLYASYKLPDAIARFALNL